MQTSRRRHSTLSASSVGLMSFDAHRKVWSKNGSTDSLLRHGIDTRRVHVCIGLVDKACPVKQVWPHLLVQLFTPLSRIFSKSISMDGNFQSQTGFQKKRKRFFENAGKKKNKFFMKRLAIRIGKKTSTKKPENSKRGP